MFHAAGVFLGERSVRTEFHKHFGKNAVLFIRFFCFPAPFGSQKDVAVVVDFNITFAFEQIDGARNARLGVIKLPDNVHRTNCAALLGKQKNGFQIHFFRFVRSHNFLPCSP